MDDYDFSQAEERMSASTCIVHRIHHNDIRRIHMYVM
jgi:hypothetical protein